MVDDVWHDVWRIESDKQKQIDESHSKREGRKNWNVSRQGSEAPNIFFLWLMKNLFTNFCILRKKLSIILEWDMKI